MAQRYHPRRSQRDEVLRHQAMAVNDMVSQLTEASQHPVNDFGMYHNRGNHNKRRPQRFRGQRGGYQTRPIQRHPPWQRVSPWQRSSHDQWQEYRPDSYRSYEDETSLQRKGSCDNDITPQILALSLTESSNFSASLLQLMERKDFPPSSVRHVALRHDKVFSVNDERVILKPKVSVCGEHLAFEGCQNLSTCAKFHICPQFVSNTCNDKNCCFGHSWTTDHNRGILNYLSLEKVPIPVVHNLFQSSWKINNGLQGTLDICLCYNGDGCKNKDCMDLHICLQFVLCYTKCKNTNCQLNHNIQDESCCNLLKKHGFSTNEAPRDITIALLGANPSLADKLETIVKKKSSQTSTVDDSPRYEKDVKGTLEKVAEIKKESKKEILYSNKEGKTEGDDASQFSTSNDSDTSEDVASQEGSSSESSENTESIMVKCKTEGKHKGELNILPKAVTPIRTLWSHYLLGDVLIPEICFYSVENMCKNEASGCQRLHATQHFHWQVREQDSRWLNLRLAQVTCLEHAFCNVTEDGVDLQPLDPATVEYSVSGLLILMGRDTWHADFKAMSLTNSKDTKKLFIRRLCTEIVKGKIIKPSMFTWYFLDQNQKWVKYGNADTLGKFKLISSVSSDDIENHYLTNPSANLSFTNTSFSYVLDFKTMQQTNVKTNKKRELRRRPELHLNIEEIKSKDDKNEKDFPLTWDAMQPEERLHLVSLDSSSPEYQTVVKLVAVTLSGSIVNKIERVQNPYLWRAFQNKVKEMTTIYGDPSKVDVRQLFHGTSPTVVSSICSENFDWRLHGSSSGQSYGRGTYFSTDPKYSYNYCRADAKGYKFMFVAKVALGSITTGNNGMVRPPINPATNAPFDSSVNSIANFNIVVKYDKQEYYPEYILTLT